MGRLYEDADLAGAGYGGEDRPSPAFSEALSAFRSAYPGNRASQSEEAGFESSQGDATGAKAAPLSVSGAMSLAKGALEDVSVRLVGEVSEVSSKAGYKAVYFTVKDEHAALPCMMWTNRYRSCGVELCVGQLVELFGRFTLYAAKGRMNFDVFSVKLAGEGDLRMRVAALARKFEAEGLTSRERKRPLPALPESVGLVTSPRGAAVHDVLRTLRRRYPMARVLLAGVPVEGANAPAGLAQGIGAVVSQGAEVVLLVRGGGSFEDLMPFNDEMLARTIAACPAPVVTGIGHEPDTTVADMVSDLRASTPTAAAEAVSPGPGELGGQVDACAGRMRGSLARRLDRSALVLQRYADRPVMRDPHAILSPWELGLDARHQRLARALPGALEKSRASLESSRSGLARAAKRFGDVERARIDTASGRLASGLARFVERPRADIDRQTEALRRIGPALVESGERDLGLAASRLNDLSPLATLSRGYAILRDEAGAVVKSAGQAPVGSAVEVTLRDGSLKCEVIGASVSEGSEADGETAIDRKLT